MLPREVPPLQLTYPPELFLLVFGAEDTAAELGEESICGRCCLLLSSDGFAEDVAAPLGDTTLSVFRALSRRHAETKLLGSVFLLLKELPSNSEFSFATAGGEEKPGACKRSFLLGDKWSACGCPPAWVVPRWFCESEDIKLADCDLCGARLGILPPDVCWKDVGGDGDLPAGEAGNGNWVEECF